MDLFRQTSGRTATSPDTTPPSVAITSPANNSTVGSCSVAVAGYLADSGSGIKRVMVRIRAGTVLPHTPSQRLQRQITDLTWSVRMNLSSAGPTGPYRLKLALRTTQETYNVVK